MKLLTRMSGEQRRLILGLVIVFAVAIALRANIGWSFSNNGIDEGVMLQRSLLVSHGYELYTEIPCDQAPLAFLAGSIFGGDVVSLRSLSAVLSLTAIAACIVATRKLGSDRAMIVTGVLMATDFVFLRESRLFSLDGMTASLLAISVVALVPYLKSNNRLSLAVGSLTIGIAASVKLLGVLALGGLLVLLIFEMYNERSKWKARTLDLVIAAVAAAIPLLALMLFLGPSEVIDGMLFGQASRGFDLYLKLSLLAYFGINFAYIIPLLYSRRIWALGRPERFLLCSSFVMIAFMVVQPLIFLHHMAIMSPFLAVLTGLFLKDFLYHEKAVPNVAHDAIRSKKDIRRMAIAVALVVINLTVSISLSTYGVITQGEPLEIVYARELRALTHEGDWVVSGSPIIASYAGRMIPPEVVNVAYRQSPDLTEEILENAILDYDVAVVVICYRLSEFEALPSFLQAHNYSIVVPDLVQGEKAVLDLFQEGIGSVTFCIKTDIAAARGIPVVQAF